MKKVFLGFIIFFVCLSFVRLAYGTNEEINVKEIFTEISNCSNSSDALKEVFNTYQKFMEKVDPIFDKLDFVNDEKTDQFEDNGDWEEKDGIIETVVGFFNWVAYVFKSLFSLVVFVASVTFNIFPIINALLTDLLVFVRILFYLIYAVPMS